MPPPAQTSSATPPRLEIRPGIWLDSRLAIFLCESRTLVAADLHWGYAHSHRSRGNLLPAWGDAEIAQRLHALIAHYQPTEMIWLGDSLHTLDGRDAAEAFLQTAPIPMTIVAGNHDARWNHARGPTVVVRSGFHLHHGDQSPLLPTDAVEITGHHHPAFVWRDGAGTRLKLPALIASPRRIILPAFSPWAAGAPWFSSATDETVYAIGTKRIFTLPPDGPHKEPFVA